MVSVYMIVQNNFYQNWTSDIYTSERAARTSPKSFYKSEDVRIFLNKSLENPENEKLKKELCILNMEVCERNLGSVVGNDGEESTTWPQSTTGIAVITVGAFLLVALLFCLTCCICVCCLREEKEKE